MPFNSPFNFFGSSEKAAAVSAPEQQLRPTFDSQQGAVDNYVTLGKELAVMGVSAGGRSKIVLNFIGMSTGQANDFIKKDSQIEYTNLFSAWLGKSFVPVILPNNQKADTFVNVLTSKLLFRLAIKNMCKDPQKYLHVWIVDNQFAVTNKELMNTFNSYQENKGHVCIVKTDGLESLDVLMSRADATYSTHQRMQAAEQQAEELSSDNEYYHVSEIDLQGQSFTGAPAAKAVPGRHANFGEDTSDDPEFGIAAASSTAGPVKSAVKSPSVAPVRPAAQATQAGEYIPMQDLGKSSKDDDDLSRSARSGFNVF